MVLELLLCAGLAAQEPGFGGVEEAAPVEPASAPADPGSSCVMKDDSGAWVSCEELLAREQQAEAPPADEADFPVDPDRARATSLLKGMSTSPVAAAPQKLTPIEEDLARLGRSADEFPLAALRRDVQRLDLDIAALESRGAPLAQKAPLEERRAELLAILEKVEALAMHRMTSCAARRGIRLEIRPFRMTPGGPVALTTEEMMAALPKIDPEGCERITLVDQALVDRVKRFAEVEKVLETRSFGYHQIAERRKLERERDRLKQELENDAAPRIVVPGASGL